MNTLYWGILGTGSIAHRFAQALAQTTSGKLVAVGSRSQASALAFAEKYEGVQPHGSYRELLADPEVQAVYISTPHPQHAESAIAAARAGKHILCEKPATMNAREAEAVIAEAKKHGVFFMEAFMYRCHPQTARIVEVIRSGVLGEIFQIEADFSFQTEYRPESRLFSRELGGGGILDVGCYCMSLARTIAGAAVGEPFANPSRLQASGKIDPTQHIDLLACALLEFPSGIVANLTAGLVVRKDNHVKVWGSQGKLTITLPWFAGGSGARLIIENPGTSSREEINTEDPRDLYAYEIDLVAQYAHLGEAPAMTPSDTLGNMQALDQWRKALGVTYQVDVDN